MNVHRVGRSAIAHCTTGLRLINFAGAGRGYTNAQLDDHQGRARRDFCWRPPLRLALSARFSHDAAGLHGTAGFGFWNDPFLMTVWRWPALPQAIWFFFASPPSDMTLALDVPGDGWKAAVIDAGRTAGLRWLPLTPLFLLGMRFPVFARRFWPVLQRDLGIAEARIAGPITAWRRYEIEWGVRESIFRVDGHTVLDAAPSPRGPLGLVIWIDNQWMVVHPSGRLGHGILRLPHDQWLEIEDVEIRSKL